MNKLIFPAFFLLAGLLVSMTSMGQPLPAFWQDIQRFRTEDSLRPPARDAIVFAGSSSFTKWTDVQDYFPGYPVINRGFGGSTLVDLIRYAGDIIIPYHPRQVVIYCGDNDLASSDTVTARLVKERFQTLFGMIRQKLPQTVITYISIKPSPSRLHLMAAMEEANKMISDFLKRQPLSSYEDVFHAMLGKDHRPLPGIFLSDSLHMNAAGYAIWKKQIAPRLLR